MRYGVRALFALTLAVAVGGGTGLGQAPAVAQARVRWTEAQAQAWGAKQPWLVGANFIPSDAINELEMFQAETFNPGLIDRELGLGASMGMNTMRIFLQDQLWGQDAAGFKRRVDTVLTLSAKHGIRPILVLFDSCWEAHPKLGPQHPPIPGVHNSGWVQSPGQERLARQFEGELKAYVVGIVGAFANDPRVLAWDVWNEPFTPDAKSSAEEVKRGARVVALVTAAFGWARSAGPTQPLTSGLFSGDWSDPAKENAVVKVQLAESDVVSFHRYDWPERFEADVVTLEKLGRPILCTEYMARSAGSVIDTTLPIAKKHNVAAINWGLVMGKTQTMYPWDSWQRPYTEKPPVVWFHDLFHEDGTPYRREEFEIMRRLTGRGAELPVAAKKGDVVSVQ